MTVVPTLKMLSLINFSSGSCGYAYTVQTGSQNGSGQNMISLFRMPPSSISVSVNSKTLKCSYNSSNTMMGEKSERSKVPHVLTVAGSDSGAGAGIQADMKACGALGVYCSTVITAVTAQNTVGVQGVHQVPDGFVYEQLRSVLSDMEVNVVKTGMLPSTDIIRALCRSLREYPVQGKSFYRCQRLSLPI